MTLENKIYKNIRRTVDNSLRRSVAVTVSNAGWFFEWNSAVDSVHDLVGNSVRSCIHRSVRHLVDIKLIQYDFRRKNLQ